MPLELNERGYFEARGLNVRAFNNWYDGNFSDAKISGIELIHHEVRTATNGDVRLSPTPGQWDIIPQLIRREVHQESNSGLRGGRAAVGPVARYETMHYGC